MAKTYLNNGYNVKHICDNSLSLQLFLPVRHLYGRINVGPIAFNNPAIQGRDGNASEHQAKNKRAVSQFVAKWRPNIVNDHSSPICHIVYLFEILKLKSIRQHWPEIC